MPMPTLMTRVWIIFHFLEEVVKIRIFAFPPKTAQPSELTPSRTARISDQNLKS
jgi:hypothetical protein